MVPADHLEDLLRMRLEGSGFFGARFRENAGRSLLLSKGRFNERKPLWMSRLQSQKLMDSVLKYEDFPILLETWRTCLRDEFDMDNLKRMLEEIASREIRVSEVETSSPSPFAQSVAWDQINIYMYMSDTPKSTKQSNLREDLLKEVVFSPGLRPQVERSLIDDFVQQRQRLLEAWLPGDEDDLEDWVKERSVIPAPEWRKLLEQLPFSTERVRTIADGQLVVSIDDQERIESLLSRSSDTDNREQLETLIANWMQYYGPLKLDEIQSLLTIPVGELVSCLLSLTENEVLISGELVIAEDDIFYCDADNFEYLLRLQRARRRTEVVAKPLEALTPYMYAWQTRNKTGGSLDQLFDCIEKLRGVALPAALWESEILPARLADYKTDQLDLLFQESDLIWVGSGEKQVAFCLPEDLDLVRSQQEVSDIIQQDRVRLDYNTILDTSGRHSGELTAAIWDEVWQARITNDSIIALRRGIDTEFKPPDVSAASMPGRRRRAFGQWRSRSPMAGSWYRLPPSDTDFDSLEQQEIEKEKVRLMLNRYGIVFRELCGREADSIEWRNVFRSLRLMELSGEVTSGHFFKSITGPQFMTPEGVRAFQEDRSDLVFFLNAVDPVSPSGLGLGSHGEELPRRVVSNYLVYHSHELVMTVARRGKELTFMTGPDADEMDKYLGVLSHMIYRSYNPAKQLKIDIINGKPAIDSPYRKSLEQVFNVYSDYKSIVIQREI